MPVERAVQRTDPAGRRCAGCNASVGSARKIGWTRGRLAPERDPTGGGPTATESDSAGRVVARTAVPIGWPDRARDRAACPAGSHPGCRPTGGAGPGRSRRGLSGRRRSLNQRKTQMGNKAHNNRSNRCRHSSVLHDMLPPVSCGTGYQPVESTAQTSLPASLQPTPS